MAKKQEEEKKEEPVVEDIDAILKAIITAALVHPDRGVPCLVGPTQYGKTKWVYELFTNGLGIEKKNVVVINPQNDLPEDIAGWPFRKDGALGFTQPANIPEHLVAASNYDKEGKPIIPWAIFVDEMDKAQEATLSCMLTLMNPDERRLRRTFISPYVPIICAMNEPEGRVMPDPLLARLAFFEFPPQGYSISSRPHLRAVRQLADDLFAKHPVIKFPARPDAPGSLHKLVNWLDFPLLWDSETARRMIVRSLFPEAKTAAVLARLNNRTPNPSKEWALAARPQDVAMHIAEVLSAAEYPAMVEMLVTLVDRANNNDASGELENVLNKMFESPELLRAIHRPELLAKGQKAYLERLGGAYVEQAKTDQKRGTKK